MAYAVAQSGFWIAAAVGTTARCRLLLSAIIERSRRGYGVFFPYLPAALAARRGGGDDHARKRWRASARFEEHVTSWRHRAASCREVDPDVDEVARILVRGERSRRVELYHPVLYMLFSEADRWIARDRAEWVKWDCLPEHVYLSKEFARQARRGAVCDEALLEAVGLAEAGAIDADIVATSIKQRVARAGRAARAASIIIAYWRGGRDLPASFAKARQANIGRVELETFQKLARLYDGLADEQLDNSLPAAGMAALYTDHVGVC